MASVDAIHDRSSADPTPGISRNLQHAKKFFDEFLQTGIMVACCWPLASCSGEVAKRGEVSEVLPSRSLIDNATTLEMTDAIVSGSRVRTNCSGTVCESSPDAGDYSLAPRHAEWLLANSDTGRAGKHQTPRKRVGNIYLNGNFYGPNAEETASVFEFKLDFISGGWFAKK